MTSDPSAPYKTVTKRLQKVDGSDEALLTCQSDGYPEPSVQWWDGHGRPVNASTAVARTPQQLFAVTSEIRVRFPDDNNYTCSFGGGYSATFLLAGDSSTRCKTAQASEAMETRAGGGVSCL